MRLRAIPNARAVAAAALVLAVGLGLALLPRGSSALAPEAAIVFGQTGFSGTSSGVSATAVNNPGAILVDWTDGRVWLADTGNNRVISWTTIDEYQAGQAADMVLGQPDFTSNTANNPVGSIGGLSAKSLSSPSGLAADGEGRLYVADTGNNRVLLYTPPFSSAMAASIVIGQTSFTSNTAADPPTMGTLRSPVGIAVDEHESLVVADRDNNRVLGYLAPLETGQRAYFLIGQSSGSTNSAGSPGAKTLSGPTGVVVAQKDAGLWVADTGNNRVLFYIRETTDGAATYVYGQPNFTSSGFGTSATSLVRPRGLALDAGQRLLVADEANNRVLVYSDPLNTRAADVVFGQNGSFTSGLAGAGAGGLSAPYGVAIDANGDVLIADQGNNRGLGYADPLPVLPPAIAYIEPGAIEVGTTGPVDVVLYGTGFDKGATLAVGGVTRSATMDEEGGLHFQLTTAEVASAGLVHLTVSDHGQTSAQSTIEVFTPTEGDDAADDVVGVTDFTSVESYYRPPTAKSMVKPRGMAVASSGRVVVADSGQSRVLGWPSVAVMTSGQDPDLVIGQPSFTSYRTFDEALSASLLSLPVGVVFDSSGNLYVSDPVDNRVLVYRAPLTSGMAASVVIGQSLFTASGTANTATGLDNPLGLAVDASGNLYVADAMNNRILQYDAPLTNGMSATRVFGQGGSFTTKTQSTTASGLYFPYGITIDSNGAIWVAEVGNNRVLRFDSPRTTDTVADFVLGQAGSFTSSTANNGGLTSGLSGPDGVTVESSGNVWVADTANNRVVRFPAPVTVETRIDLTLGGSAAARAAQAAGKPSSRSMSQPVSVVADSSGKVLVADKGNSRVVSFNRPAQSSTRRVMLPRITRSSSP